MQANRRKAQNPATTEKFTESVIYPNGTVANVTRVMDVATLSIAFKESTCTLYKRIVYMPWDNFLGMTLKVDLSTNRSNHKNSIFHFN